MAKKKTDFEEIMKNVDFTRWMQILIPISQPLLVFGAWLTFAKFDKRAAALSKFIAMAEPIPAIDLNLPRPVVLASLFHSTETALKILDDVIDFLEDIEIPSVKEIVDEILRGLEEGIEEEKEDIKEKGEEIIFETVEEVLPESPAFKTALANCVMNAKANLGLTYWILGPAWIVSCMGQKGFTITLNYVKDKLF